MSLRVALSAAILAAASLPAQAGGKGCGADCYRQAWVPPTYGYVAERTLVRAPRTVGFVTPARYKVVTETVMVEPGGKKWVVTRDKWGKKIGCWVETAPRYATVQRKVLVEAPQVVPYQQSAEWGVTYHRTLVTPGHRAWVPAGYRH